MQPKSKFPQGLGFCGTWLRRIHRQKRLQYLRSSGQQQLDGEMYPY